ncbi:uncharacterized protein LOC100678475 isoform X1 [Nasonia vitripennis]|uniref:Repressor/activator protein 1 homolog n=1 Tax=Nasonia vitripennis TaxID=7425 RepID=A0A7M7GE74_NASVI|nr:uncharacterized protein LOC100678475 isoform X1 [Nasonia vitripennis]
MSNDPRNTFVKRNKNLFKGYSFKFEFPELESDCVRDYERIVTSLGGEVKEDAVYTFCGIRNAYAIKDKKIYQPCYILHSIRAEKPLDIELYRWINESLPECPNGSTRCYKATSLLKNDSLKRFYDKQVYCELCSVEFEVDTSSDEMDDIFLNDNIKVEPIESVDLVDKVRIKTGRSEQSNKDVKKVINSKAKSSERSPSDSERSPKNHKKFKRNSDEIKDHLLSLPTTAFHAATQNHHEQNKCTKIKVESVVKNPMVSTSKSKKIKKNKSSSEEDSNSSHNELSSDEEMDFEQDVQWWKPQQYSEKKVCKIRSCFLEPMPHLKHGNPMRNLSLQERRVLLKYLIQNNSIHAAKGVKVFNDMHSYGYLTNRSTETLRNCFRRRILPHIDEYKLPSHIEEKFKALIV